MQKCEMSENRIFRQFGGHQKLQIFEFLKTP